MKKRLRSLYIQLHAYLIKLPMTSKQSTVSIEYIKFVLKEVFNDNELFSFSDYLMQKSLRRKK